MSSPTRRDRSHRGRIRASTSSPGTTPCRFTTPPPSRSHPGYPSAPRRRNRTAPAPIPDVVAGQSEPRQSLAQTPQGGPSVFWGRSSCALFPQTVFRRRGRRTLSMSTLVLPVMLESTMVSEPAEPRPAPLPVALTLIAVIFLKAPARTPLFFPTTSSGLTLLLPKMPAFTVSCSEMPETSRFVAYWIPCWLPKIEPGPLIFNFPLPVP